MKRYIFALLLAIWTIPLLIPTNPEYETENYKSLAYENSEFIKINDLDIHVINKGQGEKTFILLHGFGSHTYTWSFIIDELSNYGKVIAYDRPGFGLTQRVFKNELHYNPYTLEYQTELLKHIIDYYELENIILIGNSAGGTVSILSYLNYPELIDRLILVSPAVFSEGRNSSFIRPFLFLPHFQKYGPYFASKTLIENSFEIISTAWYDKSKLTDEILENYKRPLKIMNWDKALWDFTISSKRSDLFHRLNEINLPVLLITGDSDVIVPTANTIKLKDYIPDSELYVIKESGHVPQEETPEEFLNIIINWIKK